MKSEFMTKHSKILIKVYSMEGMTIKEVFLHLSMSSTAFYKAKADLIEDGLIKVVPSERGRKLYLTEQGKEIAEKLLEVVKEVGEAV